jgi:two-component system copper resistance phosphate regulon response regulator CusR
VHVLLVEDHRPLRESLQRGLAEEGFAVTVAATYHQADDVLSGGRFDAVVLDRMLPGGDALSLLAQRRSAGWTCPALIITARDTVADRIAGLDGGADDYLVKPFSFGELVARLRALLRRSASSSGARVRVGTLELDWLARRATCGDVELDLTQRQFELLGFLMRHAGETVTREMIAREVWREPTATWTNVIDVQINRLRRKLGPAERGRLHTIRGEGYRLETDR